MDTSEMIFVFGSNLSGIHGAGAAKFALQHRGAKWGQAVGMMGQSYGIPTKTHNVRDTLSLSDINYYVNMFMSFAEVHEQEKFQVTCIGCGLAGLKHKDIAPMFKSAPDNCYFDTLWSEWLPNKPTWGTL